MHTLNSSIPPPPSSPFIYCSNSLKCGSTKKNLIMAKIYSASDFFSIADYCFKITGLTYNLNSINKRTRLIRDFYYWIPNVCILFVVIQISIYTCMNFGKPGTFLDIAEEILVCGIIFVMFLKAYGVIYRKRIVFTDIIMELDEIIPKYRHFQKKYAIESHYKRNRLISIICSIVYITLITFFIVMPLMEKMTNREVEWKLPFKMYYPFDTSHPLIYPFIYAYLAWNCFTCGIEVLGCDLLFCNVTSIVSMRLEILRDEIMQIDGRSGREALIKFKELIQIHQRLIAVCEKLEDLFSLSLLGDLMASTFITCLSALNVVVRCQIISLVFNFLITVELFQSGIAGFHLCKFITCLFTSLLRVAMQWFHADRLTR